MATTRDRVLSTLGGALPGLRREFGVRTIAVFGSVARGDDHPGSDVDVLVEFEGPVGLLVLASLRRRLSEILGRPVDVGTPASLRPRARRDALAEAVRVA